MVDDDRNDRNDRDDPKRKRIAENLFGTCAGSDFAPGVAFEVQDDREPTIIRARCTYCSDKKHWHIRNRTSQGIYFVTQQKAEEFAKIGGFDVPSQDERGKYFIEANYCAYCEVCGEEDKPCERFAKLIKRSELKLPK